MTIDVHLCIIATVWKTNRKKHTGEMHNREFTATEAEKEVLFSRHQKGQCQRNDEGCLSQSSMDFTNINGVLRTIYHQENKQHRVL